MRMVSLAGMLAASAIALVPSLRADGPDQARADLINQLQTAYPLTGINGIKVEKPGTVLIVQQNGIQGNPLKLGPFHNKYENGRVSAEGHDFLRQLDPTGGFWGPASFMQARNLAAGERVYLLKMEFRDEGIVMTVQTCGMCDTAADPAHKPYAAAVRFVFTKGFWDATDLTHIQNAIGALLALPYPSFTRAQPPARQEPASPYAQTQTGGGEQANQPGRLPELTPPPRPGDSGEAANPQAKLPELTPPPRPVETARQDPPPTLFREGELHAGTPPAVQAPQVQPAPDSPSPTPPMKTKPQGTTEVKAEAKQEARPEIEIGWTAAQVVAALGKPVSTAKLGHGQEIYQYEHMSVTFERGKVVAVTSSR